MPSLARCYPFRQWRKPRAAPSAAPFAPVGPATTANTNASGLTGTVLTYSSSGSDPELCVRATVAGVKPTGGRHDLVDRIERVTRYPMALLGLACRIRRGDRCWAQRLRGE